jgi:hypothetical protein
VAPAQCNIILDACESGGLVSDLGVLLKPEVIGDANTSGISIFASSAANQSAGDTDFGGVGTQALLRVICGEEVVNTRSQFLDLVDVGRVASARVATAGDQVPVVWGANLYGQSRFSKNPHYDGAQASAIHDVTRIVPVSPAGRAISEAAEHIWRLYHADAGTATPIALQTTLQPILEKVQVDAQAAAQFVRGVCTTFSAKLRKTGNAFAVVETIGVCVSLLLTIAGDRGIVDAAIRGLVSDLAEELETALQDVLAQQRARPDYLVTGSMSDMFYLPARLTRLLGWSGALLYFHEQLGDSSETANTLVRDLAVCLLADYPLSIAGMSDSEAPFVLMFAHMARRSSLTEQAEQLFGTLFRGILSGGGALASPAIRPGEVLSYLHARSTGDFTECGQSIARPGESLSLVLLLAASYGVEDEVDDYLKQLDHVTHNIFLPTTHRDFGLHVIRRGRNHVFEIGHAVWRATDLVQRWRDVCVPQLDADSSIQHLSVRLASVCAALVFPDRNPWFLLREYFPEPATAADNQTNTDHAGA